MRYHIGNYVKIINPKYTNTRTNWGLARDRIARIKSLESEGEGYIVEFLNLDSDYLGVPLFYDDSEIELATEDEAMAELI